MGGFYKCLMKKYFFGTLFLFLFSITSVCSAFDWDFTGWQPNQGKLPDDTWPHMEKTLEFQKAYNKALEKAQKEKKCIEIKLLKDFDGKYGPLTHEARVFVENKEFTKKCETTNKQVFLPHVTNGNILPGPELGNDGKSYVMHKFLPGITNWILVIITAVSVIMGIIAGLFYLTSSGDSEMLKKGKDIMIWSIAGLVIAILSFTIVKLIININFF